MKKTILLLIVFSIQCFVHPKANNSLELGNVIKQFLLSITSIMDTTPPKVSFVDPKNEETDVPRNKNITVIFSEVLSSSLASDASTLSIKLQDNPISGEVFVKDNILTFVPTSDLAKSATYSVVVGSGAKDASGNALEKEFSYSFTTGVTSDTTPMQVSSTFPERNQTDIFINNKISVQFSKVPDIRTITTDTFQVTQAGTPVEGNLLFNNYTVLFTPKKNFSPNTVYTVTLSTRIKDNTNNALISEYTFSFTTGEANDTVAPLVSSIVPANDAVTVNPYSPVSITFSEAMDISTLNTSSFRLRKENGEVVTGTVVINGSLVIFYPAKSLDVNTIYIASVSTVTKDMASNNIQSEYSWRFTTDTVSTVIPLADLSYAGNPFSFTNNVTIPHVLPTITGTPISYSVSPALPLGLSINPTTGELAGTPTVAAASAPYIVSAKNANSSTSFVLNVGVEQVSSAKEITSFSFPSPAVTGTIVGTNISVSVPFGTSVTALVATFTTTGASVKVGGTTQTSGVTGNDFTSPVTYTVTASDGTTVSYTVTVSVAALVTWTYSGPPLKTGQTSCYDGGNNPVACSVTYIGQDAQENQGVARSYSAPTAHATYTSDYTTTDNATGLVWKTCSQGLSGADCTTGSAVTLTWDEASNHATNGCNVLNSANSGNGYAGKKNWRVPTRIELSTLVDSGRNISPAINVTAFPGTVANAYWSSTTYAQSTTYAWYVYFYDGSVGYSVKTGNYYVRCVSGP